MNLEDNWLYEDGQDEIVFSVDTHCQLLGAGLCGTESYITAELELTEASVSPLVPVVELHITANLSRSSGFWCEVPCDIHQLDSRVSSALIACRNTYAS